MNNLCSMLWHIAETMGESHLGKGGTFYLTDEHNRMS